MRLGAEQPLLFAVVGDEHDRRRELRAGSSTRHASIATAVPDASSTAPGARSLGAVLRPCRCANRNGPRRRRCASGSVVPRSVATMLTTGDLHAACPERVHGTLAACAAATRQASAALSWRSAPRTDCSATSRRAAPGAAHRIIAVLVGQRMARAERRTACAPSLRCARRADLGLTASVSVARIGVCLQRAWEQP